MSAPESLGAVLRAARRRGGRTVACVAREAGISRSTLSNIEAGRGRPSLRTAIGLDRVLDELTAVERDRLAAAVLAPESLATRPATGDQDDLPRDDEE